MALTIIRKPQPAAAELPWEGKDEAPVVEQAAVVAAPEPVEAAPVEPAAPAVTNPPLTTALPNATGALTEAQWAQFSKEVAQTKDNNLQHALNHLASQTEKDTLMLVRRASGESFLVVAHDPEDGRTTLKSPAPEDRIFKIRLRDQENMFYTPFWR